MSDVVLKLLLVEDNPGAADLIREMLKEVITVDLAVTHVTKLSLARRALAADRFDIVLLDLSLPDSHGLDTVRRIRAEFPELPTVVLTSLDDEEVGLEAVREGAQDYLVKGQGDGGAVFRSLRYAIERKRLEDRLCQARRLEAIGRLAGGVAHDFNNLLTIIGCYAELAMTKLPPSHPVTVYMEEVQKASERAAGLTRQLLAFSRKQIDAPQILDLNALLTNMDKTIHRLLGPDIELINVWEPELHRVKVDPSLMEQIIMNMGIHARQVMPLGGKLVLETSNVLLDESQARNHPGVCPGSYAMLAMTDSGPGLDERAKLHLIEPYFNLGGGSDLGLSAVFGIVKQSKGHLEVESQLGRGTTFRIYLPRAVSQGATTKTDLVLVPEGMETILLVEDEDGVRGLVSQILKMRGYAVLEAPHGNAALMVSKMHQGTIHLMLTDVVMPQMTGRQLADRLFRQRPDMRILYMSGFTDDVAVRDSSGEMKTEFIQKPFGPDDLARKVREVLDAPRLSSQGSGQ